MLDVLCVADLSTQINGDIGAEVIFGLSPLALWKNEMESVPFTMNQPFWGHMRYIPQAGHDNDTGRDGPSSKRAIDTVKTLATKLSSSVDEIASVMVEALGEQVCHLLGISEKHLDGEMALAACGLDSLSAIELRDWVRKAVDVDFPIFDILEGANFQSMGWAIGKVLHKRLHVKAMG